MVGDIVGSSVGVNVGLIVGSSVGLIVGVNVGDCTKEEVRIRLITLIKSINFTSFSNTYKSRRDARSPSWSL